MAIWMAADSELIILHYDRSVIIFCTAMTHCISTLDTCSEMEILHVCKPLLRLDTGIKCANELSSNF